VYLQRLGLAPFTAAIDETTNSAAQDASSTSAQTSAEDLQTSAQLTAQPAVADAPPTPAPVSPPTVKREPETDAPSSVGEQRPAKRARPAPTTGFVDLTLDETEYAQPIKQEAPHRAESVPVAPTAQTPSDQGEDVHDIEDELKRVRFQRQRIENEEREWELEQRLKKLRRAKTGTSATPGP